jgi:hypothetical protein
MYLCEHIGSHIAGVNTLMATCHTGRRCGPTAWSGRRPRALARPGGKRTRCSRARAGAGSKCLHISRKGGAVETIQRWRDNASTNKQAIRSISNDHGEARTFLIDKSKHVDGAKHVHRA